MHVSLATHLGMRGSARGASGSTASAARTTPIEDADPQAAQAAPFIPPWHSIILSLGMPAAVSRPSMFCV